MPEDGYTTLAALAEGTDDLEMLKCLRQVRTRHGGSLKAIHGSYQGDTRIGEGAAEKRQEDGFG